MRKNTVYTKGFVNDDGCIEVPGVFLEDGAEVELAIAVESGRFESARGLRKLSAERLLRGGVCR